MSASHYLGKHVCTKLFAVFFILLGLSACGKADKPTDSDTQPAQEVALSFDASGAVVAKDSKGMPIGDKCSANPKAEDVCPFFQPGHKIQVEQAANIFIARYSGSPQCVAMIINGVWYVLPSAAYCKK